MIHARGRARSRKINYISKVKIEFGWGGARLFLLGVVPRPSAPSPPHTRGTAEILNESLLMKATFRALLPAAFPTGGGRDEGGAEDAQRRLRRGKSHGAFPQPFSALHHQRAARDFLGVSSPFFFFFKSLQLARVSEPWPRKMRYRGPGKNFASHTLCDRNCFRRSFVKRVHSRGQILKL